MLKKFPVKKITDVLSFARKHRKVLAEFLSEGDEFRSVEIDIGRYSSGNCNADLLLYQVPQSVSIPKLTTRALQKALKELGSKVTVSSDEKVK